LEIYNKERDLAQDEKKLGELKAELDKLKSGVNFVIGAIQNPEGTAKDVAKQYGLKLKDALVDGIVDGFLGGDQLKAEMKKVQDDMVKINARLNELHLGALDDGVKAASSSLQAEFEKTKAAQESLTMAKRNQGSAVEQLADMEKRHPDTTTFRTMQQFYGEVQNAG